MGICLFVRLVDETVDPVAHARGAGQEAVGRRLLLVQLHVPLVPIDLPEHIDLPQIPGQRLERLAHVLLRIGVVHARPAGLQGLLRALDLIDPFLGDGVLLLGGDRQLVLLCADLGAIESVPRFLRQQSQLNGLVIRHLAVVRILRLLRQELLPPGDEFLDAIERLARRFGANGPRLHFVLRQGRVFGVGRHIGLDAVGHRVRVTPVLLGLHTVAGLLDRLDRVPTGLLRGLQETVVLIDDETQRARLAVLRQSQSVVDTLGDLQFLGDRLHLIDGLVETQKTRESDHRQEHEDQPKPGNDLRCQLHILEHVHPSFPFTSDDDRG